MSSFVSKIKSCFPCFYTPVEDSSSSEEGFLMEEDSEPGSISSEDVESIEDTSISLNMGPFGDLSNELVLNIISKIIDDPKSIINLSLASKDWKIFLKSQKICAEAIETFKLAKKIERLKKERGEMPSHAYNYFATDLMTAAYLGHIELVEALIEAGVDVNEEHIKGSKFPALEFAFMKNHVKIAILLIKNGAKIYPEAMLMYKNCMHKIAEELKKEHSTLDENVRSNIKGLLSWYDNY